MCAAGAARLGGPPRLHRLNAGLLRGVVPVRALRPVGLLRLLRPVGALDVLGLLRLPVWLIRLLRALSAGCGGEAETIVPVLTRSSLTTVELVPAWGCTHDSSSACRSRSQWVRATAPYGAMTRNALSVY